MNKEIEREDAGENKKNDVSEYKKDKSGLKHKEQHDGLWFDDEGMVIGRPKTKKQIHLESLPYVATVSSHDTQYLIDKDGREETERFLGILPGTLDLYREKRVLLFKIKGYCGNMVDYGLFYRAETLLEIFEIARDIYEIEKQFFPRLYPDGDFIKILWNVNLRLPLDHSWFKRFEKNLCLWLNHIDNWPKMRYDYTLEKILSSTEKTKKKELDILNWFIYEATQDAAIRKLFAQEIRIIQDGFRSGRFKN